jgi:hypothetical protein
VADSYRTFSRRLSESGNMYEMAVNELAQAIKLLEHNNRGDLSAKSENITKFILSKKLNNETEYLIVTTWLRMFLSAWVVIIFYDTNKRT